ncbi:hypothetical protein GGF31_004308 [Allomyces arbusculus]|nr:hypothetical protein GGF31_004308 [Allomyces arbusculus]
MTCTVSRLAGHNRNPHLYALNELARTNSPDSLCYDLMPKPDSMATLSFSDADEESDADYCPYPDAVNDGNRVLDNPWAPNDWPRAASGYRIMRWGTGHVRFPTKKERKLPKWLARMYLAKMCHYCQHAFPMFADLVNHFHMTKKHHVHLCCNRTFKDEPAYFGHLNDVHGGDIENW